MTGSTSSAVVGTERADVCPALGQASTRSQHSGCSPRRAAGAPYSYRHPLLAWAWAEPRYAVTVNPVSVSQTKRECQEGRDGLSPRHPSLGPGLEMSMANASSFHFLPEKGPSLGLGGLASPSSSQMLSSTSCGKSRICLDCPPPLGLLHAEGLRGQGPSLQILAVSGRSSRQTPKLSSMVRQSTGRSWVPLPQVTEHCRQSVTSQGPLPMLGWV